jgi:hypothetical protein
MATRYSKENIKTEKKGKVRKGRDIRATKEKPRTGAE